MRKVKVNTEYRHFKGSKAFVITTAKHSETGEDLVIYCCVDGDNTNHVDGIYARRMSCSTLYSLLLIKALHKSQLLNTNIKPPLSS